MLLPFEKEALALLAADEPFALGKPVPNQQPSVAPTTYRIAIIGEAPGKDEEATGRPFVGQSGRLLDKLLARRGIARSACFVGNVCQHRPPGNKIELMPKEHLHDGLNKLRADLAAFRPNICLLLGRTALWAACGSYDITNRRGSVFLSESLIDPGTEFLPPSVKCLATFHPANCLRQYSNVPIVEMDMVKMMKEAFVATWEPPQRELVIDASFSNLVSWLGSLLNTPQRVACDIEGGVEGVSCISLATSPSFSVLIPFEHIDGTSYWPEEQETELWHLLSRVMADPHIEKVWQNGLYDRFVLQWTMKIFVAGNKDDTLLKMWEYNCEMPKSLAFQNSILGDEPYYKGDRKTTDEATFYRYCCRDSATTFENNEKLERFLTPKQLAHYRFKHNLLDAFLYMELHGIRYDAELAASRLADIKDKVYEWQNRLDDVARGLGLLPDSSFLTEHPSKVAEVVRDICCYKKDKTKPKAEFVEDGFWQVMSMLEGREALLTPSERGQVASLCKQTLNTKSAKKFQDFLYGTCKLPKQFKRAKPGDEPKLTTDYETLLRLRVSHEHPALDCALQLSRLRTRAQMLAMPSYEGRMYCTFNSVGTETERVTSSKSFLTDWLSRRRIGGNLQTIPSDWPSEDEDDPLTQGMRDLYIADPGCYLGKFDLKGADGWTIGAHLASLGDRTMLDDLLAGIKPAQVVAHILEHGPEPMRACGTDRDKIKLLCKQVDGKGWRYFASKVGIWGIFYLMGEKRLAENFFLQSDGEVSLSPEQVKAFVRAVNSRYNTKLYHEHFQRTMQEQTYPAKLEAPNGFIRKFLGRNFPPACEILGEALAHLPQVVTTYATMLALHRLWADPENRANGSLRVKPLLPVHDELLVQWKIEDTPWATSKVLEWFNNPIIIAGQTVTIPFSGAYGTAWSMDERHLIAEL